MTEPAFRRLEVDERRAQLLELSTDLFAKHSFDELTMASIAREAGISKGLLYHYFPSKEDLFKAALAEAAAELARRTAPEEGLAPLEQLRGSTRAFVEWVGERPEAYAKLVQSSGEIAEIREVVVAVRDATAARVLDGLVAADAQTAAKRGAVRGWLWFMDGVLLDWIEHRDREPAEVAEGLVDSLIALLSTTE